jgi:hypothetical protein
MNKQLRLTQFDYLPVLKSKIDLLPPALQSLWPTLDRLPPSFVLYGGTGLALRLGHRESYDFDFFSAEPFSAPELLTELNWLEIAQIIRAEGNDLVIATKENVRLSFFGNMKLQTIKPPEISKDNGLVVASLEDLAGTKLKAIFDRSEWKDYFDIVSILRTKKMTLAQMLGYATTIFANNFSFPVEIILKALTWFGDGTAGDLSPEMQEYLVKQVSGVYSQRIPQIAPYSSLIKP